MKREEFSHKSLECMEKFQPCFKECNDLIYAVFEKEMKKISTSSVDSEDGCEYFGVDEWKGWVLESGLTSALGEFTLNIFSNYIFPEKNLRERTARSLNYIQCIRGMLTEEAASEG